MRARGLERAERTRDDGFGPGGGRNAHGALTLPLGQAVICAAMSKPPATTKFLRIGELAARGGVSAKGLRLYEARGLLQPDAHSGGGYRLYGAAALARLHEIGVLKRAGFTLAEIGALLARKGSAAALIEARIVALRSEVRAKSGALAALERAWRGLDPASHDINQLLENIQMNGNLDLRFSKSELAEFKRRGNILGRHFTPAERAQMRTRAAQLGAAGVQQAQQEWPQLVKEVRAAMNLGIPATDPSAAAMGRRWYALIQTFTGGDAKLGRKMGAAYRAEPGVMAAQGLDEAMFAYVGAAMAAAGLTLSA